jgi:electron transfer flavoprotein alpha subunit
MSILVIAEHDNQHLKSATLHALAAAGRIGGPIHCLVAGSGCGAVAAAVAAIPGVATVLVADAPAYAHQLAENLARLVVALAPGHRHILAAATTAGKDLAPRVAALLGVEQVSDICEVLSPERFRRPIYAGSAIATVESSDPTIVVTVRPTAFPAVETSGGSAAVEAVSQVFEATGTRFVGEELAVSDRPELGSARIVVSGGRGVGSAENFALVFQLADKLGAAVGASRAAVDAGFVPNDLQVGQTGKVVAPDLYFAIGISGAIQHLAGMKDSKVIAAINSDPEAPIFQVADYGLVADLHTALPELIERL